MVLVVLRFNPLDSKYSRFKNFGLGFAILIPFGFVFCIISSFQSLIFNYNGIRFKIPNGPIADKWTNYKDHINLVNPANKRN
jgi:hypothetical protein